MQAASWLNVVVLAVAGIALIAWWWRDVTAARTDEPQVKLLTPERPGLSPATVTGSDPRGM
jgi:hypothetical protein